MNDRGSGIHNTYWGALAPHSALRPFVVLTAGASADTHRVPPDVADTFAAAAPGRPATDTAAPAARTTAQPGTAKRPLSSLWAVMLAKIYQVLPIVCRHCGAKMKPVAVIINPDALARICIHLGHPVGIPTLAPARDPPQGQFDFGA